MPGVPSFETRTLASICWRLVEAQHVVATMKLTDTLDEQEILEDLIEASKPPMPAECRSLDYLLSAPFRYRPYPHGSRFRRANQVEGVYYAAEAVETAVAEVAFYRLLVLRRIARDALARETGRVQPPSRRASRSTGRSTSHRRSLRRVRRRPGVIRPRTVNHARRSPMRRGADGRGGDPLRLGAGPGGGANLAAPDLQGLRDEPHCRPADLAHPSRIGGDPRDPGIPAPGGSASPARPSPIPALPGWRRSADRPQAELHEASRLVYCSCLFLPPNRHHFGEQMF